MPVSELRVKYVRQPVSCGHLLPTRYNQLIEIQSSGQVILDSDAKNEIDIMATLLIS
jgi:hypothetical protein